MAAIKESGPGSVPDLARQLMSKRIAVSIIRKDMDDYEVNFVNFFLLSCQTKTRKGRTIVFFKRGRGW